MSEDKKTLVSKLADVMAAVGWIEKSGYNEFHKYKYAQEADLVSALRGELAQRKVMVLPNVKTYERKPLEVETMKWDDKLREKVPVVRKTQLAEILVEWTFMDGESGEQITVSVPGVGEDNVDKGFYKAFTGSEKYMLMKSFLIPTGDDPEKDSKEDYETAKEEGRAAAKAMADKKIAQYKDKKQPEKPAAPIATLFYVWPEKHNNNFAEFVNIREFAAQLDEVAQEGLRQIFKPFLSKSIAKNGVTLVPAANMQPLLEKLNGDAGIDVKELKAAPGAG